jgi:hypothetical protein
MEEGKMLYEYEGRRGRPNGGSLAQVDFQFMQYLAKVSMKYNVIPEKFIDGFFSAYQHQKTECGKLTIECRSREKDYAIFLITEGWEVVGQFHISEHLLREKTSTLKEIVCRQSAIMTQSREAKSKSYKIRNLRAGMRRLNIIARVLKVSKPIHIAASSGFYANLSNALISDETGSINLSLFGAQMEGVTLHDVVQIENAHVAWFRGERQLRIGKRGKINVMNSTANNIEMEQSD